MPSTSPWPSSRRELPRRAPALDVGDDDRRLPSWRSASTRPSPMPLAPPVTTATRPAKSITRLPSNHRRPHTAMCRLRGGARSAQGADMPDDETTDLSTAATRTSHRLAEASGPESDSGPSGRRASDRYQHDGRELRRRTCARGGGDRCDRARGGRDRSPHDSAGDDQVPRCRVASGRPPRGGSARDPESHHRGVRPSASSDRRGVQQRDGARRRCRAGTARRRRCRARSTRSRVVPRGTRGARSGHPRTAA